ncbi:hypothetical protein D1AOALGA4SA_6525 [Olavius algarvensis Delta 1 endosymbiont]|nr:hypothetical protein D1AOALGA4SA_6525 [Olavius algarvensis Delta 1 endosymbiont]
MVLRFQVSGVRFQVSALPPAKKTPGPIPKKKLCSYYNLGSATVPIPLITGRAR